MRNIIIYIPYGTVDISLFCLQKIQKKKIVLKVKICGDKINITTEMLIVTREHNTNYF